MAEQKARAAEDKLRQAEEMMIEARQIEQGSLVWVMAMAMQIGPVVHIPAEAIKKVQKGECKYGGKRTPDGSMDLIREGYFESLREE